MYLIAAEAYNPATGLRELLIWGRGQKGASVNMKLETNACKSSFPVLVKSMRTDSGNRHVKWPEWKHEWKKYKPRSIFFLPEIPESEHFEIVILYGSVYVFVYILLSPWTTINVIAVAHIFFSTKKFFRLGGQTHNTWHVPCIQNVNGCQIYINKDLFTQVWHD